MASQALSRLPEPRHSVEKWLDWSTNNDKIEEKAFYLGNVGLENDEGESAMGDSKVGFLCKFFEISGATLAIIFTVCLVVFYAASQARAQQTDADFSAYCRAKFSNSSYQHFSHNWGTEHACVQGGTRQGIDLAEACKLTTGSRKYQVTGARVLCAGVSEDAQSANANDLGSPDLKQYCIDNFPNSSYERRAEPGGYNHYCRRPGSTTGFTLQPIDLFQACQKAFGTKKFRKDGVQVFCIRGDGEANPTPPRVPNQGSASVPKPQPTPDGTPPSNSAEDPTSLACQSLGGAWHGGTLKMVDKIVSEMNAAVASCNSGTQLCQTHKGGAIFAAYMQTIEIMQCHLSFIQMPKKKSADDLETAVREACAIKKILEKLAQRLIASGLMVAGAMDPPFHSKLLKGEGLKDLCTPDPENPGNIAAEITSILNELKNTKEAATEIGTKRENLDDEADNLRINAKNERILNNDIKLAEALEAKADNLEAQAIKLQVPARVLWEQAIELAQKARRLLNKTKRFGEASKIYEQLALMHKPSLRPDYREPRFAQEFEMAALAQEKTARAYAGASGDAIFNKDRVREREMRKKAIEALEEAQRIWQQAASAYENAPPTLRDGKLDKDETRKEREKAKRALKSADDLREIIQDLNDGLQDLPE